MTIAENEWTPRGHLRNFLIQNTEYYGWTASFTLCINETLRYDSIEFYKRVKCEFADGSLLRIDDFTRSAMRPQTRSHEADPNTAPAAPPRYAADRMTQAY